MRAILKPPAPVGKRVQPFEIKPELLVLVGPREIHARRGKKPIVTGQPEPMQASEDADRAELVALGIRGLVQHVATGMSAGSAVLGIPASDDLVSLELK